MISFDEAVALVCGAARPLGTERVPLARARNRVLAEQVRARVSSPPCDVSAMDGYAVREADLRLVPARLKVVGESFPGRGHSSAVGAGTCVRIFTGAPVPEGADRVVIQEVVRRDEDIAFIDGLPGPVTHIRRRASDFAEGDILLKPGRLLDARALVAAAGADVGEVAVWRRPRVAILSTGDELAEPGRARDRPGSIPESISYGVGALIEDWGAEHTGIQCMRDELAEMKRAAAAALDEADVVVVTGGASIGERDYARRMFEDAGLELIFSKVAMKPGKPVWFGRAAGRLVMGLPGNPTSALVTARLLLAPLLAGLTGRDPASALQWRTLRLADPVDACGERETFIRARRAGDTAYVLQNQESNAQKTLAEADLLVRRPPHAARAEAGEPVEVIAF